MHWVLLLFAVVAAGIAVALWIWRSRMGSEMALMGATETSKASDVAGKPPGTVVELKGVLRATALLTSEFAQQPCVWYRALTEREIEKRTTGSGGKSETRREFETVSDVVKFAPATVDDGSGSVALDFDGAKVEGEQVHRRYESGGLVSAIGGLLNVGGTALGHRYTEWVIAAEKPVYVLATALAGGRVGKSADKKNPFVVSIKSEEERTKSLGRSRIWAMVGAIVGALIAVGFLYGAIVNWGQ